MSDQASRKDIRLGLAKALKDVLAQHEDAITDTQEREARGVAKLAKSGPGTGDTGNGLQVPADSGTMGTGGMIAVAKKEIKPQPKVKNNTMKVNITFGKDEKHPDDRKGACPVCHSKVTLTSAGMITRHSKSGGSECAGSGQDPKLEKDAGALPEVGSMAAEGDQGQAMKMGEMEKNAMQGYGPKSPGVGMQVPGPMGKTESEEAKKALSEHIAGCRKCWQRKGNCKTAQALEAKTKEGSSSVGKAEMCKACGYEHSPGEHKMKKDEMGGGPDIDCPACGGERVEHLGDLGSRSHFFCRNCGMQFSHKNSAPIEHKDMTKVTPPDISEATAHKLKDEYGHDESGKAKAYATMWSIHNKRKAGKSLNKEEMSFVKEKLYDGVVKEADNSKAKMPGDKTKEIDAPGSGGEETDGPDVKKGKMKKTESITSPVLKKYLPGAIHAIRVGTPEMHPETRASLKELNQFRPTDKMPVAPEADLNKLKATKVLSSGGREVPFVKKPAADDPGSAQEASNAANLAADKKAAGVGFLRNLISKFKKPGTAWSDLQGTGPASAGRVARTMGSRMTLAEKKDVKKTSLATTGSGDIGGMTKDEPMGQVGNGQAPGDGMSKAGMSMGGKPAMPKPPKAAGSTMKTTPEEANKELKGFKSVASNPTAMPKFPGMANKPKK